MGGPTSSMRNQNKLEQLQATNGIQNKYAQMNMVVAPPRPKTDRKKIVIPDYPSQIPGFPRRVPIPWEDEPQTQPDPNGPNGPTKPRREPAVDPNGPRGPRKPPGRKTGTE
eukprot:CAMPEP_0168627248 /NCGR_PEP_ID=MMETSP0449_2-20121227/11125_1 /TAXON_ID=1082188 /ORGANISM="Strombidium rassoulzadegani, Strain ras09" /LENGTH=110 /DNA_ID=CAMNT_0008669419 /DNA_START=85 /DNA_END=417 /DNA_ORIENTATION=+